MKLFKLSCSALLIAMASSIAFAETSVIVSSSNPNSAMDQMTVSKIFLGKAKSFPDGSQALPVDQDEGSKTREAFNTSILGKSDSQLKSYWSRLIFTGKGTPPKQSGTDAEIRSLVANNPNIIGYIDSSAVDGTVKVVHKF
ncbi:MAG: ABC-type phosphate transport system substrate-binding protein [Oleispira sp.]|jgi:ABC-type phosphate transport system substrate-binding protein